jgi:hypothetical protein
MSARNVAAFAAGFAFAAVVVVVVDQLLNPFPYEDARC